MLDVDLAKLYGVETSALNRVVRRNLVRFPTDFMFQLTALEKKYDTQFKAVFDAIRELMKPIERPKRRIGIINNDD